MKPVFITPHYTIFLVIFEMEILTNQDKPVSILFFLSVTYDRLPLSMNHKGRMMCNDDDTFLLHLLQKQLAESDFKPSTSFST